MISEDIIVAEYNRYREIIGRGPNQPSSTDLVYAHFKAGYMMAAGLDLKTRGVCPNNWQGNKLEASTPGEDLL